MERTLAVPETGRFVRASLRTVEFEGTGPLSVWVESRPRDAISLALANGRFALPAHYRMVRDLVPVSGRVLDVGAHIGTFSLFCAALGHEVLAIEASPNNAALLRASAEANGFERLHVVCAAASGAAGTVPFRDAGPYGYVSQADDAAAISVPAVTVASEVDALGWDRVDFVKLDIEGSEVAAIRGLLSRLGPPDAPPLVFESNGHTLNLLGQTPRSLLGALEVLGYCCFWIQPSRLVPVHSRDLQPDCNIDCLALKDRHHLPATWSVAPPLSADERVARCLASMRDPHPHPRAYMARALEDFEEWPCDTRIAAALGVLADDPDADVRRAAEWWRRRVGIS